MNRHQWRYIPTPYFRFELMVYYQSGEVASIFYSITGVKK